MGAAEGDEVARQPVGSDGLAGPQEQATALQACEVGQRQLGHLGAGEHGPSLVEEDAAGLGQLDPTADAGEEARAMPSLQRSHCGADGGLSKVQRLGRTGDMLSFGDGNEDAELLQRHRGALTTGIQHSVEGGLATFPIRCIRPLPPSSGALWSASPSGASSLKMERRNVRNQWYRPMPTIAGDDQKWAAPGEKDVRQPAPASTLLIAATDRNDPSTPLVLHALAAHLRCNGRDTTMSKQTIRTEGAEPYRFALQEGEPSVIAAFVAVAVIWTGFILAATGREICLRRLVVTLALAALAGLLAGTVREVVIGRRG